MKRKRHKIGDVVIVSGAFWENFGVIGKVVEVNKKIITVQDDTGDQFTGVNDDFFTVDEVKKLTSNRPKWNNVINFNHPWLNLPPEIEPSCCDEFKGSDFKFCPRCGDEL